MQPAQSIWSRDRNYTAVGKADDRVALVERTLLCQRRSVMRDRAVSSDRAVQSEKRIIAHAGARYCWPLKSL